MEEAIEETNDVVEERQWSRHRAVTRAMADKRRAFVVRLDLPDDGEQAVPANRGDQLPQQPNAPVLGHKRRVVWLSASTVTPSAGDPAPSGT